MEQLQLLFAAQIVHGDWQVGESLLIDAGADLTFGSDGWSKEATDVLDRQDRIRACWPGDRYFELDTRGGSSLEKGERRGACASRRCSGEGYV